MTITRLSAIKSQATCLSNKMAVNKQHVIGICEGNRQLL